MKCLPSTILLFHEDPAASTSLHQGWHLGANSQAAWPRPRPRIHQRHAVEAGWCDRTCFPCWVLDQHLGGSVAWHPATKRNSSYTTKKKGHQNTGDEPPHELVRGPILGRKILALFFSKFWAFCMRFYPLIWSTWMRLRLDFNRSRKRTGTQMSPQWSRESPLSKQFVKESSR